MKKIAFSIVILSALSTSAIAQKFINGSFEPSTSTGKCKNDAITNYNATMGGMWVTGNDSGMYIADNTCGLGAPVNGSYFVRTQYKPMKGGNYIMLKLTVPMSAGTKYKFSFSYRASAATALIPLLGYSNDSSTHVNYDHAVVAPTSTSWVKMNDSLTPTIASQYIWVAGSSTGGNGEVFFDDFAMEGQVNGGGEGSSVANVGNTISAGIYPNPVTDISSIILSESVQYPVSVSIYDVTGKLLLTEQHKQNNILLKKAQLNTGLHILKIKDANGETYATKILVQ